MNIFEQIQNQMKQQFQQQQEASYLLPTDLNTVLMMLDEMPSHPPDVSKLEGCNVIAVLPVGTYVLFSINPNNETPPNRNVKCYSHGNGASSTNSNFHTERDVVEVFNFIQNNCIAWVQI